MRGLDVADTDLRKFSLEKLVPFGSRLIIPFKERYVDDLPTEGSEET